MSSESHEPSLGSRRIRTAAVAVLLLLLAAPSGAQQLSADGRSAVGRTTTLDRLVQFLDPDRLLIGLSSDELKLWAERLYPQEGTLHNRAGHRLGSRILTDRFGAVTATALGIANEIFEAYNLRHTGAPVISTERFDLEDLAANFRGVYDSYAMNLNTPWGLVRLVADRLDADGSVTRRPKTRRSVPDSGCQGLSRMVSGRSDGPPRPSRSERREP